ncbi:hypothetical protein EVAR_52900_1 [Eumeta japonica]|uniref:Uncharacterized protein n=1 Tax=Eumeta variegata TaxID=151549 RepID=A0A4C1Z0J7_EUMVA|nr:hypothetical protein EVAR_52900_1 [Eumeta japonica]
MEGPAIDALETLIWAKLVACQRRAKFLTLRSDASLIKIVKSTHEPTVLFHAATNSSAPVQCSHKLPAELPPVRPISLIWLHFARDSENLVPVQAYGVTLNCATLVDVNVMLKNDILDIVDMALFPGLTLDAKLPWNFQIKGSAKRLSFVAYVVKRIRLLTDENTARLRSAHSHNDGPFGFNKLTVATGARVRYRRARERWSARQIFGISCGQTAKCWQHPELIRWCWWCGTTQCCFDYTGSPMVRNALRLMRSRGKSCIRVFQCRDDSGKVEAVPFKATDRSSSDLQRHRTRAAPPAPLGALRLRKLEPKSSVPVLATARLASSSSDARVALAS